MSSHLPDSGICVFGHEEELRAQRVTTTIKSNTADREEESFPEKHLTYPFLENKFSGSSQRAS